MSTGLPWGSPPSSTRRVRPSAARTARSIAHQPYFGHLPGCRRLHRDLHLFVIRFHAGGAWAVPPDHPTHPVSGLPGLLGQPVQAPATRSTRQVVVGKARKAVACRDAALEQKPFSHRLADAVPDQVAGQVLVSFVVDRPTHTA